MNCAILKTPLYTIILCLMRSCNSWRTCTISKLCFTLIYNVLSPAMLCGCDLYIATPHCVQSVLKIANHNRLGNSSEPRNRESIKWDCAIVYSTLSSISSPLEPWTGGPLLDAPYWHTHLLQRPHSFLPGLPPGLWSYCYFEGCLSARVAFTKAWTSSNAL